MLIPDALRRYRSLVLVGACVTSWAAPASAGTYDCVMNPSLTVKLGSPVASILSDVLVDRGDIVKRGQVIAQIESSVEQAAVATAQTRAESSAEIDAKQALLEQRSGVLRRKKDLATKNFSSAQDVDTAQAEYDVAQQELLSARLNRKMAELELARMKVLLEQKTIRSPIAGIVTARALGPGEYIRPEVEIVTVARIDPLNVEAYLPVRYYNDVKVGDTADVQPDQPVGGHRSAQVSVVDQVFDAASGTFGVRLSLPNRQNSIPAGLRCKVTFNFPDDRVRGSTPSQN